jgi:hypothetical protein
VLRQHHCTVMDVARAHPQLCQAEAEEFARVLGADVEIERGATRALGDRVCECAVVRADPARDADDVDPPDDTTTLPMWQGEPADGTAVPG